VDWPGLCFVWLGAKRRIGTAGRGCVALYLSEFPAGAAAKGRGVVVLSVILLIFGVEHKDVPTINARESDIHIHV
jgi:hypothetical protein